MGYVRGGYWLMEKFQSCYLQDDKSLNPIVKKKTNKE